MGLTAALTSTFGPWGLFDCLQNCIQASLHSDFQALPIYRRVRCPTPESSGLAMASRICQKLKVRILNVGPLTFCALSSLSLLTLQLSCEQSRAITRWIMKISLPVSVSTHCITNRAQSCPTLCDPMDCSPSSSSVLGISQTRIPGWVAISISREFSRESSRFRD